jgi:hypothetical protein
VLKIAPKLPPEVIVLTASCGCGFSANGNSRQLRGRGHLHVLSQATGHSINTGHTVSLLGSIETTTLTAPVITQMAALVRKFNRQHQPL